MTERPAIAEQGLIGLTTDIVAAYVSNNPVPTSDLPGLIAYTDLALSGLGSPSGTVAEEKLTPAVSIKKSVTPDFLTPRIAKSSNRSSAILRLTTTWRQTSLSAR